MSLVQVQLLSRGCSPAVRGSPSRASARRGVSSLPRSCVDTRVRDVGCVDTGRYTLAEVEFHTRPLISKGNFCGPHSCETPESSLHSTAKIRQRAAPSKQAPHGPRSPVCLRYASKPTEKDVKLFCLFVFYVHWAFSGQSLHLVREEGTSTWRKTKIINMRCALWSILPTNQHIRINMWRTQLPLQHFQEDHRTLSGTQQPRPSTLHYGRLSYSSSIRRSP